MPKPSGMDPNPDPPLVDLGPAQALPAADRPDPKAEEDLKKYEVNRRRREARAPFQKTKEEVAKIRMESILKARAAMAQKMEHKKIVQQKVKANMPITEDERELLAWVPGRKKKETEADRERDTIAAASKLLIKPTHVTELRVLVERTAAKYAYNPIEELIQLTRPVRQEDGTMKHQVTADDRISIHKSLLPFLVPQLSVPKTLPAEDPNKQGMKVVITEFVFPEELKTQKIHEATPTTVATTVES